MGPEHVLEHLQRRLPRFEAGGAPERCDGSARTEVWRVPGEPEPVIVKAPAGPAEAGAADAAGLWLEARSLRVLGPTGALAEVGSADARPPRLIDFDEAQGVLVEEDVGPHPDLSTWLEEGRAADRIGHHLGRFVAALHRASQGRADLAGFFESPPPHRNHRLLAPDLLAELCRRAGVAEPGDVLARADVAVQHLQQGRCLVAGHLGPTGIVVTPGGLRVVDWSGAHFGSPAEDVGYLTAHLWMRIHRAPSVHAAVQASIVLRDFLSAYAATFHAAPGADYAPGDVEDCAVHFGAALLASAVGSGMRGSLYADLSADSPVVQEAAAIAVRHLRMPDDVDMFSVLRADRS